MPLPDVPDYVHDPGHFADHIVGLNDRHDLFERNSGNVAKQHLINRGLFTVVWREFGGKQRPTTKLTGRGIVHYARELGVRPPGVPAQALLPGL